MNEEELRRYLELAAGVPLLGKSDEFRLSFAAKQGDESARNQILQSNARLVVSIARRYSQSGVDLGSLVEVGDVGLRKALDSFDADKGYRFSTYATWFIRQAITRRIADGN